MSTRARKDRKKAGIPLIKPQKVGTPVEQRSFVTLPVFRRAGDAQPIGAKFPYDQVRSPRRVRAFILSGGIRK